MRSSAEQHSYSFEQNARASAVRKPATVLRSGTSSSFEPPSPSLLEHAHKDKPTTNRQTTGTLLISTLHPEGHRCYVAALRSAMNWRPHMRTLLHSFGSIREVGCDALQLVRELLRSSWGCSSFLELVKLRTSGSSSGCARATPSLWARCLTTGAT